MKDFFNKTISLLHQITPENARLEARMIWGAVLEDDYAQISGYEEISPAKKRKIMNFVRKRQQGWPMDKIVGQKSFYKYGFYVNTNVLSPRPETEILVENAVEIIKNNQFSRVLDLGTGSGCILISIVKDCEKTCGTGVDVSAKALNVAKKNAQKIGVENQLKFLQKSWYDEDFCQKIGQKFELIVSNPPYITSREMDFLPCEVKNFDPQEALCGGKDGLDDYHRIAAVAPLLLQQNGYILLEVGKNQASAVIKIFEKSGFLWQKTQKDLAGIERCIIFKK